MGRIEIVEADRDEVMRIVEKLKKDNPLTLKLLGYPTTFRRKTDGS